MTTKKDEEFDEDLFETRLEGLRDTQEGIQQMSSWVLEKRAHHKKIVQSWLNVFKKTRVEQRLVLFYLANDVIQYSKRKRYEFVESWATALQRATTMVRDERVKSKILRIFKIWSDREIYNEDYLTDLRGLLNIHPPKKPIEVADITSDEFSNPKFIVNIRECVQNADATDKSLKKVPKMTHADAEILKQQLKDKSHTEDVEKDLDRYITYMKAYYKNLQTELKTRKALLIEVGKARKFYHGQLGEVRVVAGAYKNFGLRIKNLQKKLNELTVSLPSPIPSPDINAPSPEPDADIQLPDDHQTTSATFFKNNINGYSSYLDGNLPFDISDFKPSSQPIEVIGTRSDDESFNSSTTSADYYKPSPISAYSSNSNISIPGLTNPISSMQTEYTSLARSSSQYGNLMPPPNPPVFDGNAYSTLMSAYSTDNNYSNTTGGSNANAANNTMMPSSSQHIPPPPMPPAPLSGNMDSSSTNHWNMNMSWNSQNTSLIDTPISPPRFERDSLNSSVTPLEYSEQNDLIQNSDVDHRQLHLAPFSIGAKLGLSKEKSRQLDIDHRNLISLTGSPHTNDGDKNPWSTTSTGDIDYRTGVGQTLKTIDTIPMPNSNSNSNDNTPSPNPLMPPPLASTKYMTSPMKSNASSSSESQKEDTNARYDPTDMVIDMDMSDEDLDDILKEVEDQKQQQQHAGHDIDYAQSNLSRKSGIEHDEHNDDNDAANIENGGNSNQMKPPLLETPAEYGVPPPPHIWDTSSMMNMPGYGPGTPPPLPPPRMPFSPAQQQYQPYIRPGGNGRGRGAWGGSHGMHAPYRPQQMRPARGGGGRGGFGGNSYFNRGGGGGGFRGRRGNNNAWI